LFALVVILFFYFLIQVELFAARVENRALCAIAQAESLRYKLLGGLAVRRACYGVLRYIMENGAKGVEIIVTGKLRAARAKVMKFKDGYMIKTGDAVNKFVDKAVCHINLKQGVLGIHVAIMLPTDSKTAQRTTPRSLPDVVIVPEPKPELIVTASPVYVEPSPAQPVAPTESIAAF
jgi:small subunit ribosomal protein S3e